jgi:peptidoglycan/xylan/chitin deacetylase (PgdA/CDA1 family)
MKLTTEMNSRRIPITMCHGVRELPGRERSLSAAHFERLMAIASELGFASITYDQLAVWRAGTGTLPDRPLMIDFDHPVRSMRREVFEILSRHGYVGNLFINTGPLDDLYSRPLPPDDEREWMTWDELGELRAAGWHLGAHTVTHPNLSELSVQDPTGKRIAWELDTCNATIERHLGFVPQDFAFTGTSWSSIAEREVMRRYRFGRLWIISDEYQADGKPIRYGELAGVPGPTEADGGPPFAARYITRESHPYRLPSMELEFLIHAPDAFRRYLEGAL